MRVPWTARRSNQSILKEVSSDLMRSADLFEKILMLGKIEGRRKRGRQRIRWLDGLIKAMDIV